MFIQVTALGIPLQPYSELPSTSEQPDNAARPVAATQIAKRRFFHMIS
ncbi:hypothetical protein AB7W30_18425 [Providencia manganoxydans]|nr:hypothetical protein [Providencia sp. PROV255]